jgi:ABC-type cobalt transport system substrate-binding protein
MMILFFAIVLFLALIVVNFVQLRQFSENDIEGNMNCVNGKKAYKHWYKNGYSKRKSREYPNLTCRPSSV